MLIKKPLKARNKKTYVAFVLDKSGSMESIREATISSFNEQLQEHQSKGHLGGETYLSLIQFNSAIEESFFNTRVEDIEGELTPSEYSPSGGTALYDAIGYTLKKLQKFDEAGDIGFLVLIISDGQENQSSKYGGAQISSLKKELEDTGRWTFQYIGCEESAIKQAKGLGFSTAKFDPSKEGVKRMSDTLTASTNNYYSARSAGACSLTSFMNEEETP